MVYIAKGGFWSLLGQGTQILASAAVVLLLINILPKELFGQYRFILSIIPILTISTLTGIDTAIARSVARGENLSLPDMARTKVKWGMIGSAAALLLSFLYYHSGDTFYSNSLIAVAIFLPFFQTFSIYSAYYKGKQDFKSSTIYDSSSKIFFSALIIIIALLTKDALAVLYAFLIGQLLAYAYFYVKTLKDVPQSTSPAASQETIVYGKHLSGVAVIDTLTANIDKLLVGYFLGADVLAVYYVALTIPNNLVSVFNIIPRIALPKFARNSWEGFGFKAVVGKLFPMFTGLLVAAGAYALLVPFVIPVIFREYSASIPIAVIFSLLIVITPLNAMIGQILQARKWVKKIIFLQALMLAVFSLVFLVVHGSFNIEGAAIALILSKAIPLFVGLILIRSGTPTVTTHQGTHLLPSS